LWIDSNLEHSKARGILDGMSLETLKSEIQSLSPNERREIGIFALELNRLTSRAGGGRSLGEICDDKSPGQWLTMEEADVRLGWDKGDAA
jgi:hypothetical protein